MGDPRGARNFSFIFSLEPRGGRCSGRPGLDSGQPAETRHVVIVTADCFGIEQSCERRGRRGEGRAALIAGYRGCAKVPFWGLIDVGKKEMPELIREAG